VGVEGASAAVVARVVPNNMKYSSKSRNQVLVALLIATLVASSGCTGLLSGEDGTDSDATPSITPGVTTQLEQNMSDDSLMPSSGTDFHNISVPNNGSNSASGELDGDDPHRFGRPYQPYQFTVNAGTRVNITMQTEEGDPALRLVNPNGTIADIEGDNNTGTARLTIVNLSQGGDYAIEAASGSENRTFEYNLTIERYEEPPGPLFEGPMSSWNETERYLEFGSDYGNIMNDTTEYAIPINRTANSTDNYVTLTYQMNPSINTTQMIDVDAALWLTYTNLYEAYVNATDSAENASWVPERIYLRTITP